MAPWVLSPHVGGAKSPDRVKRETEQRILAHAKKHYEGKYSRLDIRFRGALCYIDAYQTRADEVPIQLCRLRYFAPDRWSLAFFTYSHEKYEPCVFHTGSFFGTPEEGFDVGAVYLQR